jgi:hypothetical protein
MEIIGIAGIRKKFSLYEKFMKKSPFVSTGIQSLKIVSIA